MKIAFLSFLLTFVLIEGSALSISPRKVPQNILDAQHTMYPQIQKVSWSQEKENYECSFIQAGIEYSVVWSPEAKLLEVEMEIPLSEIPNVITEYIQKQYKHKKPKEAEKIMLPTGEILYEVEINGKDYLFNSSGTPITAEKR